MAEPSAETSDRLGETEGIHRRRPWRSLEAAEHATLEPADESDCRRLIEPIGNTSPGEVERRRWDRPERAAIAARREASSGDAARLTERRDLRRCFTATG
jgi:hypothetical protein